MEEIDTGDENRLWEESEAKRRAEFAKRIKEEAEASAKRRAEEDRLWEEAWAKRKAEVEKRMREEAEASGNRSAEEENRRKQEAEAKKKAEEENRRMQEAEAKKRAEEENRRKQEAEAKRRAEKENRRKQEAEAKRRAAEEKRRREAVETGRKVEAVNRPNIATESNKNAEVAQQGKTFSIKKRIVVGSIVAAVAIIGIWAFSALNKGPEEQPPALQNVQSTEVKDPVVLEKTNIDSPNRVATSSKLTVGDLYEGGFVFAIDPSGNTGKIAHIDDVGPMPWQDAMKIHEQLGEGWRLPTFDELQTMQRTIGQGATNSGEFSDGLYWSATAFDEYQARLLRFRDGNTTYHYNKNVEHRQFRVRAVRDFSR